MISQSQYIEHLNKIREIKQTPGVIKNISRLEKCHKQARKLRQINYNYIKKQEKLNIFEKNIQLQNSLNQIKTHRKFQDLTKLSITDRGGNFAPKSLRMDQISRQSKLIQEANLKIGYRIHNTKPVLSKKKMITEADHARKLFREIRKDGNIQTGRGLTKAISLPTIEYPKTIFSKKKGKKKKTKIVTNTQLSKFLRSRTQNSKKKRFFSKGKLHTIQKEYIQRNGYDKKGKLITSKNFKKRSIGMRSKNKKKKVNKFSKSEKYEEETVSKFTNEQVSERVIAKKTNPESFCK